VVAESHKFVRLYPLGQYDLPIEQHVLDFKSEEDIAESTQQSSEATTNEDRPIKLPLSDSVDFTPPHLISALITDSGVLTPSAVSEELIKIWF
jgi:translation initiation factor eIF-2B subunit alpha